MTHEHALELLDDYVDGELAEELSRELDRHLEGCEACRAEEAALRALLDDVGELPAEVQPPRDLWTGIAPRLESRAPVRPGAPPRDRSRWLRHPPPWFLAAAAVLLVVTTALVTARVVRPGAAPPGASVAVRPAPAHTAFAAFRPAEAEYERAIGELVTVLELRRDALAPETVATLEANLGIIDGAIRESRAALAADPNSRELADLLSAAYDAKIEVLERAVRL